MQPEKVCKAISWKSNTRFFMNSFRVILSWLCGLAVAAFMCSCAGMRPDDNLQKVVSGDVFAGKPVDPKLEHQLDEAARQKELNECMPYYADKDNQDYNGTGKIGLKISGL
jgi:hypothetical protein